MIFRKLKLKGFKSFVEPTEIVIEPGLTGIVGPNGCGKSNLVEALRFVMGELSPKQMRAGELDDVIFNGTSEKPAWDIAEVLIELDNKDRKAPKLFNDKDEIEVVRRIWRGEGSEYKVNGKDVRLKDVQLLFADAATGARSTSMVSQDRVGALITAKPEHRRALLEEAAGITGLHARRHEAELRLNSASNNLDRVKDILAEQESQLANLKKQSRQAIRYKNIQDDIKRAEAALFYKKWSDAQKKLEEEKNKLNDHEELVNTQTRNVARINVEFEEQQSKIPDLRNKDNTITAELQKCTLTLDNYEKDIDRIGDTTQDLNNRYKQIEDDILREEALAENAKINLLNVQQERNKLQQQGDLFPEKSSSLNKTNDDLSNHIIDYLDFEDGLEKALASVFGDDLMASIDEKEKVHWKNFKISSEKTEFPSNIIPLINLVKSPENLQKKLGYVGLIKETDNANEIQKSLKDGQVLVSEHGEIWRWDGFTSDGKQNDSIKALVEQLKNRRIKELTKEERSWHDLMIGANNRVEELKNRKNDIENNLKKLELKPDEITIEKEKINRLIDEHKIKKTKSSSELMSAEKQANEINKDLKLQEIKLGDLREEKVRMEGIISTHNETLNQIAERIKEKLDCLPENLVEVGNINLEGTIPNLDELESKLEKLNQERERLGGVNLLAEQEATELEETVNEVRKEREDLIKAIQKLRDGILQLNKEGRQRLLAAYGVVNENFQKLFNRLFGGGKAYLKFTDENDPLESGLEVFASPPGKKLQNLILLSGGEKALTALSLLFAVFLSNPAPICVLDEVDAALDDTNVDRFCSLVEEITRSSSTKFLIITHHRMTMARVNRLFGVTMPNRGISQIVSVELEEAEKIREVK
tara:strand:+ start:6369 stop:8990 length:2622 start_codon:yes stop_codon:yes gene_type:complete